MVGTFTIAYATDYNNSLLLNCCGSKFIYYFAPAQTKNVMRKNSHTSGLVTSRAETKCLAPFETVTLSFSIESIHLKCRT